MWWNQLKYLDPCCLRNAENKKKSCWLLTNTNLWFLMQLFLSCDRSIIWKHHIRLFCLSHSGYNCHRQKEFGLQNGIRTVFVICHTKKIHYFPVYCLWYRGHKKCPSKKNKKLTNVKGLIQIQFNCTLEPALRQ